MNGSDFIASLGTTTGQAREDAIYDAAQKGSIPSWSLAWQKVRTVGLIGEGTHVVELEVAPDYFAIGTDEDFVRMPMWPGTAQRIADLFSAALPTTKIVDLAWAQAPFKLQPKPTSWNAEGTGTSSKRFADHNRIIEQQIRDGLGGGFSRRVLLAGHKKDLVLGADKNHVAIYGWQNLATGIPIQGYSPVKHDNRYVDYSHGLRLVKRAMQLDGADVLLDDIVQDPKVCKLLSDFGTVGGRYPGATRPGGGGGGGGAIGGGPGPTGAGKEVLLGGGIVGLVIVAGLALFKPELLR